MSGASVHMTGSGKCMNYQELTQQADRLEALGDLESLQAAHNLLLESAPADISEIERERLWGRIFYLREQIMELAGLPPITLSDADLAGFKVVSVD